VESNQPERVKLQELARYIDEAARPGIREGQVADLAITEEQLDKMLENIRSSRTFLDGLKAAQPLVLATTTYGGRLLDRMDGAVRVAASEVDSAVESRFAPLRENIVEVERIHSRIVHNFNQLYRVRFGEEETLSDLFRANPGLSHLASASRRPTPQELDTIERRLAEDLERVDLIRKQLAPEFETYREYQKELEALRVQTQDIFRLGRTTLVVWSRAHRNLAAGIPVPPDIDMVALFRAAQNAAGKLPVF
jgi:hypothetical protein